MEHHYSAVMPSVYVLEVLKFVTSLWTPSITKDNDIGLAPWSDSMPSFLHLFSLKTVTVMFSYMYCLSEIY